MKNTLRTSFLAVVLLLCLTQAAWATLYLNSGQYTFRVRVTNDSYKTIDNARGRVYISGKTARIDVESDGYRDGYTTVYLNDYSTSYSADVRLSDPTIRTDIVDQAGHTVYGAYTNTFSQSMYWGDEYGVRGDLPKEGFEQLKERDLDVRVNHMYAFAARTSLSDAGSKWRVEVVVKRRDLDRLFNYIDIIVKRDPEEAPETYDVAALQADYAANQKLQGSCQTDLDKEFLQGRLESLARRIRVGFVAMDAGEQVSFLQALPKDSPLQRELKAIQVFNGIHE